VVLRPACGLRMHFLPPPPGVSHPVSWRKEGLCHAEKVSALPRCVPFFLRFRRVSPTLISVRKSPLRYEICAIFTTLRNEKYAASMEVAQNCKILVNHSYEIVLIVKIDRC